MELSSTMDSELKISRESKVPSKKRKQASLCAMYDFTISEEKVTDSALVVAKGLRQIAKKWVFQREVGKTGYKHFQVRCSLHKKKRPGEAAALIQRSLLKGASEMKPTSTNGSRTFDYVMKLDTRVEGPWTDEDPNPEEMDDELKCPPNKMQKWVIEVLLPEKPHPRGIIVLVNPNGHAGKTWLMKWLKFHRLGVVVEHLLKREDISASIQDRPLSRLYICNLPKAQNIKPAQMREFWAGMEGIKDGYCADKRHHFAESIFKTPHVIVCTNMYPDRSMLSADRWLIYTIERSEHFDMIPNQDHLYKASLEGPPGSVRYDPSNPLPTIA